MKRKSVILDLVLLAGGGLVVAGAAMLHPAAGLIAAGGGLIVAVRAMVRSGHARRRAIR